ARERVLPPPRAALPFSRPPRFILCAPTTGAYMHNGCAARNPVNTVQTVRCCKVVSGAGRESPHSDSYHPAPTMIARQPPTTHQKLMGANPLARPAVPKLVWIAEPSM